MTAGDAPARARQRIPVRAWWLFAGLLLTVASNNLFTPLLPDIQHGMGESTAAIGAFVSAYGLARLIVDLPSGAVAARLGPRAVIVIGVLTNTVASVFAIVAPTFALLIVARIGSGVGAGLVATVVLARLSEIAPPEIRGRVMSLYQVANNLGIAVYPLLGGVVGSLWGWRSAYVLVAVLSLASGAVLAPGLGAAQRAATDPEPRATPTAPGPRRTRFLVFGAVYFGVVASMINRHGFRNTVLPLYAAADVHLTAVQSATGITLMSLVSVAATIPGAALGDRIGRKRIVVAGLTIVAIGDIVFPMLATTYLTFVIAAMLVGAGDFFSSSQTAVLAELADGPRRSLALGAYRFFVDLGALIGPAMLGALFGARGMTTTMTVAAVILLAAAVVNQLIVPRTTRAGPT